jgi:cyclase
VLNKRIIPCLLIREGSLIKTIRFKKFKYLGDPSNTIRIFNELEVDELILLDISASKASQKPNFKLIEEVANECFMPLTYGGGINSIDDIRKILKIGVEKVSLNDSALNNPEFITKASNFFGNQCIIGSIDVKKNLYGKNKVFVYKKNKIIQLDPIKWAVKLEKLGAGELIITSVDRDGTWEGYDQNLIKLITDQVSIPVVANGGAGSFSHINDVFNYANCSAAAVGSLVVYQKKDMGVLINYPFS